MKFFIASPWRNKEAVKELSGKLAAKGCDVYSFLESGANLMTGRSIADEIKTFSAALKNWESDENIKRIFESELDGLKASDVVVLLQPAGHSSLLETGIGYGMGKRVVIIGDVEKPEVFYLIATNLYPTIDAFIGDLGSYAA